ncbi:unnamed protein product [Thelazia callipaeda]|uniref:Uncharacterized protein n=1 Tax=Thelazia callipaeda TaxID=103827 RepID=A0A0N5CNU6_THECL|nr:unnamed protein product [Thelazia callipaeda]
MFFYSSKPRTLSIRRFSAAYQGTESWSVRQIREIIAKKTVPLDVPEEKENAKKKERKRVAKNIDDDFVQKRNLLNQSPSFSNASSFSTFDTQSDQKLSKYQRHPTVAAQTEAKIGGLSRYFNFKPLNFSTHHYTYW